MFPGNWVLSNALCSFNEALTTIRSSKAPVPAMAPPLAAQAGGKEKVQAYGSGAAAASRPTKKVRGTEKAPAVVLSCLHKQGVCRYDLLKLSVDARCAETVSDEAMTQVLEKVGVRKINGYNEPEPARDGARYVTKEASSADLNAFRDILISMLETNEFVTKKLITDKAAADNVALPKIASVQCSLRAFCQSLSSHRLYSVLNSTLCSNIFAFQRRCKSLQRIDRLAWIQMVPQSRQWK